jgi:hypothetical protein
MSTKIETMGTIPEKGHPTLKSVVFAVLALWLGLIIYLGSHGAFVGNADSPPLPIFFGAAIPLAVFFTAYFSWGAFRTFILSADLRLVTAIQAWRWAGLGFLSLYAYGILPALFAFPAGLGDMAVGVTAPWILLKLVHNSSFAASRRYVMWNIFGIIDFIVAVSMGVLSSGFFPGIARLNGNITTSPLAHLPLILIPAYMVPLFIMLHCTALFQARQLARADKPA